MNDQQTVICYTAAGQPVSLARAALTFRPGVYAIAFTDDRGQVLLTRNQGSQNWELPGGGIELGETMRDALEREFQEEVGLQALVGEAIYFSESFFVPDAADLTRGWHALKLFYLVHTSGSLDPSFAESADSGGGNYGAAWVPVDELDALAIADDNYDAIQRAVQWLEMSEGPSLASADDDDE